MQIRNPWGDNHEWNGAFGDNHDASWDSLQPEFQSLRHKDADGIFWMAAPDMLSYYTHIEVLHFNMLKMTGKHLSTNGLSKETLQRWADRAKKWENYDAQTDGR